MATFNHISGQEPSTVTFKLATVQMTRNSSAMQQEIMSLGDPDSSAAIAAVLNTTPASTAWALAVREAAPSTGPIAISSIAGPVTVRSSAANALVSVYQSTAADLNVTVAGYVAPSTVVSVSTGSVRVHQSTAADLNVTVAGYVAPSTTVSIAAFPSAMVSTSVPAAGSSALLVRLVGGASSVSSIGGIVAVRPSDTNWASSAGFHFDSSGALNIAGNITATAGSSLSTGFISVRISDGSTWVTDYLQGSTFTSTAVAGGADFCRAGASSVSSSDTFVIPWASTQGAQYIIPVTDSGVSVMDSTNRAINVNVVAGSAASTIVSVAAFPSGMVSSAVAAAGSSALLVRIVGGASSISSIAGIVAVRPSDTNWASSAGFHFDSSGALQTVASFTGSTGPLTVTQLLDSSGGSVSAADSANNAIRVNVVAGAAGGSTIVTVSTGSVRVHQSSAADLNVTVAGYSTTVNVSSLAGAVIVRSSAANFLGTAYQSTYTDLQGLMGIRDRDQSTQVAAVLNAAPASTVWALAVREVSPITVSTTVNVSSLAGTVTVANITPISSVAPSSGSSGLVVRPVIDAIATFASTSALASTTVAVVSSAANIRTYVTAYSITSTNQTPAHWGFFSSNGTLLWPITLAAFSSGVAGANLAVSPPGYLFRTAASDALNFKTAGSTVSGVQLGVSYYLAP